MWHQKAMGNKKQTPPPTVLTNPPPDPRSVRVLSNHVIKRKKKNLALIKSTVRNVVTVITATAIIIKSL